MWLFIALLIWTTHFTNETEAKRDFVIELYEFRFNATPTSSYLKTLNSNLYNQKYVSVEFALKRVVTEFELRYRLDMLKKDNKRVNIMAINLDGCKALEATYTLPLIVTITKEIFRKGNLPRKCPVQANELFYIRNFTFNEEDFPKFSPVMAFQTFTEFYFEKQYQGYLTLRGRIRKK